MVTNIAGYIHWSVGDININAQAIKSDAFQLQLKVNYLWPPIITQGVTVLSTFFRYFLMALYCALPTSKLCSVLIMIK